MANEAQIRSSLQVRTGNLFYQSQPTSFSATVTGAKGPTPGAITTTVAGTIVDFSQLTQPGLCRLMNLDTVNFVTVGVSDGASFFPVAELLPGETYLLRLSRYLNQEFSPVTGTGTNSDVNVLMIKADTAPCIVLAEAFEN